MKRFALPLFLLFLGITASAQTPRWTEKDANEWYGRQPWLAGCNYIPSYAINQLEMWQGDTFDPIRIDMELGWAESIGMNTIRVFLHDLVWKQDGWLFKRRLDRFLGIADKHKMKVVLVFFDSCWDPYPQATKQRAPKPGVHNSGWVQSPGAKGLQDPAQGERMLAYVKDVVTSFAKDKRILAWDLWNEPDNLNSDSYGKAELPGKVDRVVALLPRVFEYARAGLPTQPLTSAVWQGDWSQPEKLSPTEKIQLELSDVISFHNYDKPEEFARRIEWLKRYNRPMLCTEYLARGNGSTFQGIMPLAKERKIAVFNWGLVSGKTQTRFPWDSWKQPYVDRDSEVWHHDVFQTDGTPYRAEEVDFIREVTGRKPAARAAGAAK